MIKAEKKILLLVITALMFSLIFINSANAASDIFSPEGFTLTNVWGGITSFFKGDAFLNPEYRVGAMRFLIWIFLFAILWAAGGMIPILQTGNTRTIVAFIIALISVLFMPDAVLLSIGEAFGTFFSFLIIGGIIIGGLAIVYLAINPVPGNPNYRFMVAIRIIFLLVLLFIILNIRTAVLNLPAASGGLI